MGLLDLSSFQASKECVCVSEREREREREREKVEGKIAQI